MLSNSQLVFVDGLGCNILDIHLQAGVSIAESFVCHFHVQVTYWSSVET